MRKLQTWLALGSLALSSTAYGVQMELGGGPAPVHPGLETGTEVTQPATTERLGAHNNVRGRITSIDRARNVLLLETAQYGSLQLFFQPNDIDRLTIGEYVSAELGLWPGSLHEDPLRAGDAPVEPKVPKNDRTLTGSISTIDHNTGLLGVTTEERGELKLAYPIDALKSLHTGDRVTIQIAFNKADSTTEKKITAEEE